MSTNYLKIEGKYNIAIVYTKNIDNSAIDQIKALVNLEFFKDCKIAIMPDVHAGAGCVIGLTMTLNKYVIPNLVGVDIGCGMLTLNIGNKINLDFEKLDNFIKKNIPHGFDKNKTIDTRIKNEDPYIEKILTNSFENTNIKINKLDDFVNQIENISIKIGISPEEQLRSLGSLGGGNHFIEVDKDDKENYFLVIHTGSRHFGWQIANYHQDIAKKYCQKKGYKVSSSLSFLEDEKKENYLFDMKIAQVFAKVNRFIIASRILEFLDVEFKKIDHFETIHNYINFKDNIIRKGAVSAYKGEKILIPINMRDGSLISIGKGNSDWNFSAPHGAGRIMSRNEAKKKLSLEEFKETMKGIYSTTINRDTLDEAPFAYKGIDEIIKNITETVEIEKIIKPIYNFKAPE
ncbi:MAG: RtcB family protein [Spirochaetes bacterium]|nr:RtcB family protein [Spirochaetota bacterium]